ncbi:ChbG/HpnK family deacetylase [Candidimonas sp. SYP-B2681]|nr:ChbG/HpnK family deacetylase [Candidimonas sp. SYP-B2681]
MNAAVDEGILELARLGRLNATSCLVDGSTFSGNAARLRASGLQLGLHLNFTESLGQPGLYLPVSRLILRTWTGRMDVSRCRDQIAHQLDRFEAVIGRPPDFVDGHQHIHQFPQIRGLLLEELKSRFAGSLPWLRYTGAGSMSGSGLRLRIKAWIIQVLGAHAFAKAARRQSFATNRAFLGVYDFSGGEPAYSGLLRNWLQQARDGDLIMCHPACQVVARDALGRQRQAEFDVLRSDAAGTWLKEYGVVLA